jgi:hypothetical protein
MKHISTYVRLERLRDLLSSLLRAAVTGVRNLTPFADNEINPLKKRERYIYGKDR